MSDTPDSLRNGMTYADAGVDIDAGEMLVDAIKPLAKSTRRPGAEASLGDSGRCSTSRPPGSRTR